MNRFVGIAVVSLVLLFAASEASAGWRHRHCCGHRGAAVTSHYGGGYSSAPAGYSAASYSSSYPGAYAGAGGYTTYYGNPHAMLPPPTAYPTYPSYGYNYTYLYPGVGYAYPWYGYWRF